MTLTINIDEKKLQKVRSIVEKEGKSVEKALEDYLDSFLEKESMQPSAEMEERPEFKGKSPLEIIREMTKDINISADVDEREDYHQHIIRKHA